MDGVGSFNCNAGDLVLLAMKVMESEGCVLSDIVELLRLMEPTVSMTVTALAKSGFLERHESAKEFRRIQIVLTEKGQKRVNGLISKISDITIPRKKAKKTR